MANEVKSPAVKIRSDVSERVVKLNIRDRVVSQLVEEEAGARTTLMSGVLVKRKELEKDLRKVKPDQVAYNEDGSEKDASYSKKAAEDRKKIVEQITRIDKALEKAIDKADYEDLKNIK